MRLTLAVTFLLFALVTISFAQTTTDVSLADAARQSKAHNGAAKHVYDDQNSDFGRSGEDAATPCGAPIPMLQSGYVSSLMGKTPDEELVSKALLKWLDKHLELDVMHPEDIAKINFPRTVSQAQLNRLMAIRAADQLEQEATAASSNPGDPAGALAALMSTPITTGAGSVMAAAVRSEQQRRFRSDGSQADRLAEAVNLYSICESRRIVQFEGEVDQLAKAEFKKRMTAAPSETAQGK